METTVGEKKSLQNIIGVYTKLVNELEAIIFGTQPQVEAKIPETPTSGEIDSQIRRIQINNKKLYVIIVEFLKKRLNL